MNSKFYLIYPTFNFEGPLINKSFIVDNYNKAVKEASKLNSEVNKDSFDEWCVAVYNEDGMFEKVLE